MRDISGIGNNRQNDIRGDVRGCVITDVDLTVAVRLKTRTATVRAIERTDLRTRGRGLPQGEVGETAGGVAEHAADVLHAVRRLCTKYTARDGENTGVRGTDRG